MVATIVSSYMVLLALVYFPPLQTIFQTIPLSFADLTRVSALTLAAYFLHKIRRDGERRWDAQRETRLWEEDVV